MISFEKGSRVRPSRLDINGEVHTIESWAERLNLSVKTLRERIRKHELGLMKEEKVYHQGNIINTRKKKRKPNRSAIDAFIYAKL